jgi:endoglucanase
MNNMLCTLSKFMRPPTLSTAKVIGKIALGLALAFPLSHAQADVAPLSVSGNKVLIGGQPGSLAGNSLFWSNTGWGGERYYNAQVVAWLKSDWKSSLVRASMGADVTGGYFTDSSNKTRVTTVVDAAIANDMYVIIDWHSHEADKYPAQAIAFFKEMATKYGNRNNVIYEIYNEPLQVSWSGVIKPYATSVTAAIRAIDPDNLIIVGTPAWSQQVDVAAADPITGYKNIAYTLHFYAGSHGQWLRDRAQTALNRGAALFVTEWGSTNADGDGAVAASETALWMAFMKANNISHANWSLTDKSEGSAALVAGATANGGWSTSQLTASGNLVRNYIRGWPAVTPGASSSKSSVAPSSASRSSASKSSTSIATSRAASSKAASSVAGAGSVSCTYVVSNSWATGFTAAIRVTNNGTAAKSGWAASWQYTGANRMTSAWNAVVTGANPYTATNVSWNGTIAAGKSAEFGFQGSRNGGAVEIPAVTCR